MTSPTPTATLIASKMKDYDEFCKQMGYEPHSRERHLWMGLNDTPFTQGTITLAGSTAKEDLDIGRKAYNPDWYESDDEEDVEPYCYETRNYCFCSVGGCQPPSY